MHARRDRGRPRGSPLRKSVPSGRPAWYGTIPSLRSAGSPRPASRSTGNPCCPSGPRRRVPSTAASPARLLPVAGTACRHRGTAHGATCATRHGDEGVLTGPEHPGAPMTARTASRRPTPRQAGPRPRVARSLLVSFAHKLVRLTLLRTLAKHTDPRSFAPDMRPDRPAAGRPAVSPSPPRPTAPQTVQPSARSASTSCRNTLPPACRDSLPYTNLLQLTAGTPAHPGSYIAAPFPSFAPSSRLQELNTW